MKDIWGRGGIIRVFIEILRVVWENPIIILIFSIVIGLYIFFVLLSEKKGGVQKPYAGFSCPNCGKSFNFDISKSLKKLKCPDCGSRDVIRS